MLVSILHVYKSGMTIPYLLLASGSTALAHILQLAMDEPFFLTGSAGTTFRNLAFLSGDIVNLYVGWTLSGKMRRKWSCFVGFAILQMFAFRVFFADDASFA